MEDLIPLIIVIAISIIGALGKKKKPPVVNRQVNTSSERVRDEDIFNWLEKFDVNTHTSQTAPVPQRDVEPEIFTYENNHVEDKPIDYVEPEKAVGKFSGFDGFISPEEREAVMDREGGSFYKKAEKDDAKPAVSPLQETVEEEQEFEFDIRQAVIYSEILNRKYA